MKTAIQMEFDFEGTGQRPKSKLDPVDYELIAAIQTGNGTSSRAFDELLARHIGLVLSTVKRFRLGKNRIEEAKQAGILGLWEAAKRFDLAREVRFSSYAIYWIYQRIQRDLFWKSANRRNLPLTSLDALNSRGDERPLEPVAGESYEQQQRERQALKSRLDQAIERTKINRRDREILLARMEGWTFQDLGDCFSISRERVRQIVKSAVRRLRETDRRTGILVDALGE